MRHGRSKCAEMQADGDNDALTVADPDRGYVGQGSAGGIRYHTRPPALVKASRRCVGGACREGFSRGLLRTEQTRRRG